MPIDLLAFTWISVVVIVTPGQDTALTIRNTLTGGRRAGFATAIGVATGQAVWALATSVGIAALIVASEPIFVILKLVGAGYLIVLGLRTLLAAMRGSGPRPELRAAAGLRPASASFRQGLVSNLGNPKMAVFFTSLLPQFVAPGDASFLSLLVLGLVFCSMTLAWLSVYAVAVARAGDVIRRPSIRRLLDAVLGAVFLLLGIRVATSTR